MNKKFYITPESEVVLIQLEQSILDISGFTGKPEEVGDGEDIPQD